LHRVARNALQRSPDWLAATLQRRNDGWRLPPFEGRGAGARVL
jgi:hypothetical protein